MMNPFEVLSGLKTKIIGSKLAWVVDSVEQTGEEDEEKDDHDNQIEAHHREILKKRATR